MAEETANARRNREAADAWMRGRDAIGRREPAAARFWLERACRIAPDDWRPRFELALLRAVLDDPEAVESLVAVAEKFDCGEAWLALSRLHRRRKAPAEAAAALAELLRRHEAPEDRDFDSFAGDVAHAVGVPGWCAIRRGRLEIHATNAIVTADGNVLPGPPRDPTWFDRLDIAVKGRALLGSPVDLAAMRRLGGVVTEEGGAIVGWAIHPAAPDRAPTLILTDRHGARRTVRPRGVLDPVAEAPFLPRHRFRIGASALAGLAPPFTVASAAGVALSGTPLDPAWLAALAPATRRSKPRRLPPRAQLCAVMPVYRDATATAASIASFHAAGGPRLVVVDDATPEPALARLLDAELAAGRIALVRHRRNRGFPAAANAGIRAARRLVPGCDILLLNADILLPSGAPARLHEALYAGDDIASATPFSNEATILSYPSPRGGNPAPDLAGTTRLDALARRANGASVVEIPTAIGFCMAMRHDALDATGGFDAAVFAQGYGEENDWCRRAAACGFRHVGVPGVFVAHRGGASFGASAAGLCARNLDLLERMHPGYRALIAAHHAADPLREARFRLDRARFRAARGKGDAVALVSHDHGGGIARVLAERMTQLRAKGQRAMLLQPDFSAEADRETGIGAARLADGDGDYPNLLFDLPRALPALLALLKAERVRHVEYHHTLGHHPAIRTLAERLGVPAEHVVHDYAAFCKRVNLIGPARRYCGEPDVAGCEACIATAGSELTDPISPRDLLARSAAEFRAARQITAPSADAAVRLRRHFPGIAVVVSPWEDDGAALSLKPPGDVARIVAVAGGIGPAKGYDVLLDCARDAAVRDLPLSFVLIGASEDDTPLLETGRVMVTGPYREGEAPALIRRSGAALGFLPSIWPETWCFALSELWRGGLYAVGFDLGAQAARIRATGRGVLLPLGLPAARINRLLLAWRPDLGDLTNHASPRLRPPAGADLLS